MGPRLVVAMAVAAAVSCGTVVTAFGGVGEARTATVPAAPPAGTEDAAAAFVRDVVRLIAENRYAEAWPLLHPSHRAAAARGEYVTCERHSPIPGRLLSVQTGSSFDEPTVLSPGAVVESRAVRVRVVLLDLATIERTVVTDTVHAVSVSGRWTWILPPDRLAAYMAGRCPDAPPTRPGS